MKLNLALGLVLIFTFSVNAKASLKCAQEQTQLMSCKAVESLQNDEFTDSEKITALIACGNLNGMDSDLSVKISFQDQAAEPSLPLPAKAGKYGQWTSTLSVQDTHRLVDYQIDLRPDYSDEATSNASIWTLGVNGKGDRRIRAKCKVIKE